MKIRGIFSAVFTDTRAGIFQENRTESFLPLFIKDFTISSKQTVFLSLQRFCSKLMHGFTNLMIAATNLYEIVEWLLGSRLNRIKSHAKFQSTNHVGYSGLCKVNFLYLLYRRQTTYTDCQSFGKFSGCAFCVQNHYFDWSFWKVVQPHSRNYAHSSQNSDAKLLFGFSFSSPVLPELRALLLHNKPSAIYRHRSYYLFHNFSKTEFPPCFKPISIFVIAIICDWTQIYISII